MISLNDWRSELRASRNTLSTLSFRDRRKPARVAAHLASLVEASKTELSVEDIDLLLEALRHGCLNHDTPSMWYAVRMRLITRKRQILNLPDPSIITLQRRRLDVETGGIALFDAGRDIDPVFFDPGSKAYQTALSEGAFGYVRLGADGLYPIELRHVDGAVPEPPSLEMRRVTEATGVGYMHAPTRSVQASGFGSKRAQIAVTSTHLLYAAYVIGRGKSQRIVIICSDAGVSRPISSELELTLI